MKPQLITFLTLLSTHLWALELPTIFSDNMVLQQEMPIAIWGKADPGASVEVDFAGQTVNAQATIDGSWKLFIEPLVASFEGRDLTISSNGKIQTYEDVLVGEVWLASGQSNMGWTVEKSIDKDILLLGANDPNLRLYRVPYKVAREPLFGSERGTWVLDSPKQIPWFSSVAYQFGRDLRKVLQVPVGIINSSVGGTPSIAWTRSEAIANTPALAAKDEEWESALANYGQNFADWEKEYATWREQKGITEADYDKHKRQGAPRQPENAESPKRPASLANGMISPIAGYTVRGAIWYQGEADTNWDPESYDERLQVMIADWRDWWGREDLPFGIVQLANFMKPQERPANSHWANLRESQRRVAQADPSTGVVIAIDVGEGNDIHPREKFTVARRLARWALADVYGILDLRGGPEIVSAQKEGSEIILTFSQTGSGLHTLNENELSGFTASDDLSEPEIWWQTNFYKVDAKIISNTEVQLTIPEDKDPTRIRYAWQSNPTEANLANIERLPAGPFEIGL